MAGSRSRRGPSEQTRFGRSMSGSGSPCPHQKTDSAQMNDVAAASPRIQRRPQFGVEPVSPRISRGCPVGRPVATEKHCFHRCVSVIAASPVPITSVVLHRLQCTGAGFALAGGTAFAVPALAFVYRTVFPEADTVTFFRSPAGRVSVIRPARSMQ